MSEMLLSIIIPVYNVENYLSECINSLLVETTDEYEIILVDDGSTDASGAICDEFSNEYSNIHCVHIVNGGVSKARNVGLSIAKGKYVAFVDSDDRIERNSITVILEWIKASMVDICFMQAEKFFADESTVDLGDGIIQNEVRGKDKEAVFCYLASRPKYPGAAWSKLFRKEFLMDNNLRFPTGRTIGEDLTFVLNCLLVSNSFDALDIPYYQYRQGRVGSATSASAYRTCQQLCIFVEDYAKRLTFEKKAKGKIEASAMAFIAYEYSIILWQINGLKGERQTEMFDFMRQYSWVMGYAATSNTKGIRYLIKALGLPLSSKVIALYMHLRKKER